MMEEFPRTVLALSNLAVCSLLATAFAIGAAHLMQTPLQGSALCRACMDYRIAKPAQPGHPAQVLKAQVPQPTRAG